MGMQRTIQFWVYEVVKLYFLLGQGLQSDAHWQCDIKEETVTLWP